ncbi:hypothetical protein EV182_007387 [Spiromyces aspiralis]|uniref:Uncharacterized protein n=1 Tax=Spiromyces aspiralis TaxID=68401 RepID=A0ACC1HKX9_9FUNG|nr:hypothetical protein EV182_007387 [Spiromyces aspiralis]
MLQHRRFASHKETDNNSEINHQSLFQDRREQTPIFNRPQGCHSTSGGDNSTDGDKARLNIASPESTSVGGNKAGTDREHPSYSAYRAPYAVLSRTISNASLPAPVGFSPGARPRKPVTHLLFVIPGSGPHLDHEKPVGNFIRNCKLITEAHLI